MDKRSLIAFVVAFLAAGAAGCMGGSQPPYPGPGMASAQNYQSVQAPHQGGSVAGTPALAQNGATKQTPFGVVANAVTNNPASAAVGRAWSTVSQPTPVSAPSQRPDVLSLSNQQKAPSPSLYTSMGKLAERNGAIEKARIHYQKALETSPNDVDALLALARMEDRQGRLSEALKLYDQAVRVNPNHATARNDLGLCLARKGDFPAAVEALSRAVEIQPQRKLYRNNLATVMVELGRTEEALAQLSAVNPPAVAHYNMGVLLHKSKKVADATEHFAVAARLDPSMESANAWLAQLRGPTEQPVVAQSATAKNSNVVVPQPTQVQPQTNATPFVPVGQNRTVATPPSLASTNGQYGQSSTFEPQVKTQPNPPVQPDNTPFPTLPPAPPVPQYTPNYPTFPQQASPMRYPAPTASAQPGPGGRLQQSSWPLHQPSQVPAGRLVHAAAEPPLPARATNVYSHPRPQPLPPVQQVQATTGPAYR